MANVQIPNLPAAIALTGTEQLEIVQSGTSRRTTTLAVSSLLGQVYGNLATTTLYDLNALLANTSLFYGSGDPNAVAPGQIVSTRKEEFVYIVVAPNASYNVITAGGVRLNTLQGPGYYNVKAFNAKGDGVTDDTDAIQAAINDLPDGGVLDGNNAIYCVTSLNLKSNMTMWNFRFITKAGSVDFVAPITIGRDNTTEIISNILLFNIRIDGNRVNQTNILVGREDGGRHGFRLLGRIKNISIINCSANYCATDGLSIYRGVNTGTSAEWPFFENVYIQDCQFNWNRRCGISINGTRNTVFENFECSDNGKDLPGATGPYTNGAYGARINGNLYGWGFDAECYADNVNPSTWIRDQFEHLILRNYKGLRNYGIAFNLNDAKYADAVGYIPSKYIRLEDCYVDGGLNTEPYAIGFTPNPASSRAKGAIATDIVIQNCRVDSGYGIILRAVDGVTVSGGNYVTTNLDGSDRPYLGNTEYAYNVNVVSVNCGGKNFSRELPGTINYIGQKRFELAPGAVFNLGVARSSGMRGLITLVSTSPSNTTPAPTGGHFAANAYIYGNSSVQVNTIYNAGAVDVGSQATVAGKLQIVTSGTTSPMSYWWTLRNNDTVTLYISYLFQT